MYKEINVDLSEKEILKQFSLEPKHDDKTIYQYVKSYPKLKNQFLELAADKLLNSNPVNNVFLFPTKSK